MTKHYRVNDPKWGDSIIVVPDGKELPAEYADSAMLMDVPDDWSKSSWNSITQEINRDWPWVQLEENKGGDA